MTITRLFHRTAARSQSAMLFLLPHGGQNLARRNAWSSMAADAAHARARRDAATAVATATSAALSGRPAALHHIDGAGLTHRMAANA